MGMSMAVCVLGSIGCIFNYHYLEVLKDIDNEIHSDHNKGIYAYFLPNNITC
jgi:hypothetical protein